MNRRSNSKRRHNVEKFERWNEFPLELKTKILRNLQFPDLRNVTFLNKECMHIAAYIRPEVDIVVNPAPSGRYEPVKHTTAIIDVDGSYDERHSDSQWPYQIYFNNEGKGGSVSWKYTKKKRRPYIWKKVFRYNETCEYSALRVLSHLMKFVRAKRICFNLEPTAQGLEQILNEKQRLPLLECETFSSFSNERTAFSLLARFIAPGCALELPSGVILDEAFFSSELPRQAPLFRGYDLPSVTDEQLLFIGAPRMYVHVPRVTSKGINGLIKQWLRGERKITEVNLKNTKYLVVNRVCDGLDPSVILFKSKLMNKLGMKFEPYLLPQQEIVFGVCNDSNVLLLVGLARNECRCTT